jgi:hypothetical protein
MGYPCFIAGQSYYTNLTLPSNSGLLGASRTGITSLGSALVTGYYATGGVTVTGLMVHIRNISFIKGGVQLRFTQAPAHTDVYLDDVNFVYARGAAIEIDGALEQSAWNRVTCIQGQRCIYLSKQGSYISANITDLISTGQSVNCMDLEGNGSAGSSLNVTNWNCKQSGQSGVVINTPVNVMAFRKYSSEENGTTPGAWSDFDFSGSPNRGRNVAWYDSTFGGSEAPGHLACAINTPPLDSVWINDSFLSGALIYDPYGEVNPANIIGVNGNPVLP